MTMKKGGKEERREGGKEGRKEGGKEGRKEGGKEERREVGKEGRRKGGKEEGGKDARGERREGRKERRKEGRKDHVCSQHLQLAATTGSVQSAAELLELRGFQNYFLALSGPRFGIVFGLVRNPSQKY